MNKIKLSTVLLASNEENNIDRCLDSVKDISDEIIVLVDNSSTDKTEEIAKKYTDKVFSVKYESNFHINKQKAINKAKGKWILQMDADEVVTPELSEEIVEVIKATNNELLSRVLDSPSTKKEKLFARHQKLVEEREGKLGKPTGEVVAFFAPRKNMFLGKPLIHAGVYPDGVIRLFKNGKARLPCKSVHELMEVDGEVGWLFNDLEHHDSPTLRRYVARMNRYTDLHAEELKNNKVPKNPLFLIHYSSFKPLIVFLSLYFRHKGFLDSILGFLWSVFSALHFPMAYYKYWVGSKK